MLGCFSDLPGTDYSEIAPGQDCSLITEAIIFAIGAAFILYTALVMPKFLAPGTSAADVLNADWWTFVIGGFSRVLAITVHLGFATLIILAYRRSGWFFLAAIVAHFIVDFATFGVQNLTSSLLWTTLVFAGWAVIALVLIVRVRRMDLAPIVQPEKVASSSNVTAIQ